MLIAAEDALKLGIYVYMTCYSSGSFSRFRVGDLANALDKKVKIEIQIENFNASLCLYYE